MLSLAMIWERSLRRMLIDIEQQTGWAPVSDVNRTRKWDDSYGTEDPSRWLKADVMLEQGAERWVLDAKYKRAFCSESRADRFQMCAYALAFHADRVTLVYPTANEGDHAVRTLLCTTVGTKTVLIDSMNLPMSSGHQACMAALMSLCVAQEQHLVAGACQQIRDDV